VKTTRKPKIGLISCKDLLGEEDPDITQVLTAISSAKMQPSLISWDDPNIDFSTFDICLLKTPWNYCNNHQAFIDWAKRVATQTQLFNSPDIIQWNSDKHYLEELSSIGIPTVPTIFVDRGAQYSGNKCFTALKTDRIVVKPCISAGSQNTRAFDMQNIDMANTFLANQLKARDMMIQPFVKSVESFGEQSYIWIDGQMQHTLRKYPRFDGDAEKMPTPVESNEAELSLTTQVMSFICERFAKQSDNNLAGPLGTPLYARIDMVRNDNDMPLVAELELIEPSLYLHLADSALRHYVDAIFDRVS